MHNQVKDRSCKRLVQDPERALTCFDAGHQIIESDTHRICDELFASVVLKPTTELELHCGRWRLADECLAEIGAARHPPLPDERGKRRMLQNPMYLRRPRLVLELNGAVGISFWFGTYLFQEQSKQRIDVVFVVGGFFQEVLSGISGMHEWTHEVVGDDGGEESPSYWVVEYSCRFHAEHLLNLVGVLHGVLPGLADALREEQVAVWEVEEYALDELSYTEDLRNHSC